MAHGVVRSRRKYTEAFRRQIVEEASAPGVSVAEVARRHGMNDNVIFHWRRKHAPAAMLPVEIVEPRSMSHSVVATADTCSLVVCIGADTRVQIEAAGIEMVRAVLSVLRS